MLIEPNHPQLSLQRQCQLLGLSRATYYYKPMGIDAKSQKLMALMDERYTAYPHEGARKIARWLQAQGYTVGRYKVCSLMKQMGLEPIYPKPNTSARSRQEHTVYPYLLSDENITEPDQVWSSDITYIRTKVGHVYLTVIMDWYSRYVIEWELSTTLEADFCVDALSRALTHSCCKICNTDQGSQYTSAAWIELLKQHQVSISMDGRGRYLDNIFTERLWRSVKYECIYLREFYSVKEVKQALTDYFNYYNYQRLHQALDYRTPFQVYLEGKQG